MRASWMATLFVLLLLMADKIWLLGDAKEPLGRVVFVPQSLFQVLFFWEH